MTGRILGAILLCGTVGGSPVMAAEVVDRVAADVEGQVITLSDVRGLLSYRGFELSRDPLQERDLYLQTLDQIIDQVLIAGQAQQTPGAQVSNEMIEAQFEAYRARFNSEGGFREQLRKMEMSAAELKDLIRRELMVWRFVQIRFEPFIIVLPQQIQEYYDQELVPRLSRSGGRTPPLELVRDQIQEILTLERTNREVDRWLQEFRARASVRILLFRDPPRSANLPPARVADPAKD